MRVGRVIAGSAEATAIACVPVPVRLKRIVCGLEASALASRMACRNVPGPNIRNGGYGEGSKESARFQRFDGRMENPAATPVRFWELLHRWPAIGVGKFGMHPKQKIAVPKAPVEKKIAWKARTAVEYRNLAGTGLARPRGVTNSLLKSLSVCLSHQATGSSHPASALPAPLPHSGHPVGTEEQGMRKRR